ncbi:MAG: SoxR reducing system RseC family protein [Candidatus Thioglobus sp.]|nr:SoxR reducing system RseC family protein [Candidatus Thioglobus sp.]
MKQKFEVIEVENQTMVLKINHSGGCNSCSAKSGCGTGILANYFKHYSVFSKPLQKGVVAGDFVSLEIASSELFLRAFQLYLLPLLALFIGSFIGEFFFPESELWQISFGVLSLFSSLLLLRYLLK